MSNSLCALFLVIYALLRVGDEIELPEPATIDPAKPGIRGRVIDISMLFTTLRPVGETNEEFDSVRIRVPNNMFFQKAMRCRAGKNTRSLQQVLFDHSNSSGDKADTN